MLNELQPESAVQCSAGRILTPHANEDTEVVKALLEADTINLDLQGDCPNTPLHDATLKNHVAITELLCSNSLTWPLVNMPTPRLSRQQSMVTWSCTASCYITTPTPALLTCVVSHTTPDYCININK